MTLTTPDIPHIKWCLTSPRKSSTVTAKQKQTPLLRPNVSIPPRAEVRAHKVAFISILVHRSDSPSVQKQTKLFDRIVHYDQRRDSVSRRRGI